MINAFIEVDVTVRHLDARNPGRSDSQEDNELVVKEETTKRGMGLIEAIKYLVNKLY